ncbi:SDR family NAD(P)-dependent oxidoreductase [Actinomadura sp. 7K507]|uniref:SDR family NAD(P)-dependent oxidoreductase n=1 Tax=Actinomadura sp. 7K507 TaxID=2530365 RepID=UPI001051C531|nr:SDR family NAD(P)-dependent oxidoreductase [Actinomadura sp. 7K507]TDC92992.1 SDR family NAD(P)-dependent oxidoreductase [Actinomadura sp. 7K507]
MQIEHAVVLVSGAASGLGAATARHLAGAGARIVALDRDEKGLDHLAAQVPLAATVVGDITRTEDIARAIDSAQDVGPLTVVVNCAGGGSAPRRVLSRTGTMTDIDEWRSVAELNLVAALDVSRQAAHSMSRNDDGPSGRGVIVHVSSIAALDGSQGVSAYAATKGGLVPLVHTMARDLAPWSIRVMAVAPGVFDTPMYASLPDSIKERRQREFVYPVRAGAPEEFARLVRHIAENDYLNADCIRIDAGLRMHQ